MSARFMISKEGPIAWLINNRPDALNAMRNEDWSELNTAIAEIERDESTRVAVIVGEGRAFCAGADVKDMANDIGVFASRTLRVNAVRAAQDELQESTRRIRGSRLPYIAAVHGFAVGAGFELCMACDLVVAETGTKMGFPEVTVGVTITNGGSFFAPRLLGLAKARELAYTGELIDVDELCRFGLINRVAASGQVREETRKLAQRIATRAPAAITSHKHLLDMALQSSLHSVLKYETESLITNAYSRDHLEGANAWVERREPKFDGY